MGANPRGGAAFDDEDVARAYVHRPPYPVALYDFLFGLTATHERALDLGCGPGKVAHKLAPRFEQVDALDPSLPMLRLADPSTRVPGRPLGPAGAGQASKHANITWIHSFAETAPLTGPYDLITAGASIHWIDHAVVFPKLASVLSEAGVVAILGGDGAHDVPWQADWEVFMARWLELLGDQYDPGAYEAAMSSFRPWMDIAGERVFESAFTQSIEHFIECQHSRATWSRANLGAALTDRFDAELRELLLPHADEGMIRFTTRAEVVWGGVCRL